jgi:glycosyltransferase involved in cell wall biosynthesis
VPTICLNMIVKDEAAVIRRCLRSVRPFIDAWVIVDTGSADGTQDIVREELAGIPGELHERPWVDFATNRTEAIRLAGQRADYLYVIDADEELHLPDGWRRPALDAEAYSLRYSYDRLAYDRISLVAARLPWRYEGVLHEYLVCGHPIAATPLLGPVVICRPEGARSRDPEKFLKDARVLEEALRKEPDNQRHRFYLAQSYRDAGDLEKALANYAARAAQGGWEEEVYVTRLNIARLKERLDRGPAEVARAYQEAHVCRPTRAEALVDLARYHRLRGEHPLAYLYARAATELEPCTDVLFVETDAQAWRALDERSIAAYWVGRFVESLELCERLLGEGRLPEGERVRVETNRQYARTALGG